MPVLIAALGVFAMALDAAVNPALPDMAAAFGVSPGAIRWVIVCYVLTYALTAFAGGLAADRAGARPVFAAGLALSAVVLAAYALPSGYAAVLALRVAQGAAGGLVYGAAPALVTLSTEPERRGRALGLMSLGLAAGLVLGPLLGGALVQAWGWRAVFVFRAAVAAAVLAGAARLPRGAERGARASGRLAAADVLRWPVVRPVALAFVAHCAQFSIWLLAPFYLVSTLGLSARAGGAVLTLTALGTAAGAPLAGLLADRVGPRRPMLAGLALHAAGLAALATADAGTPVAVAGAALALAGLGLGAFQVPNLAELMAAFPRAQQGAAGGLGFLGRTLGSATGAQLAGAVFSAAVAGAGEAGAIRAAFAVAAAVAAAGLALALPPGSARRGRRAAL